MSWTREDAEREEYYDRLYNEFGPQWVDEHAQELYGKHYTEAIKEFTTKRLKSFYVDHPELAQPAFQSLAYAQSLAPTHPVAALVFATTAVEVAIKVVLLQPIVYGLVHTEALATIIMEPYTDHRGPGRFAKLLFEILNQFGGVNLKDFKRAGSAKPLWEEFKEVQDARNSVIHSFKNVESSYADLGITVGLTLLNNIFPQVLSKLDLHLHNPGIVCGKKHTIDLAVYFPIPGHAPSISATVELDLEDLDFRNAPDTLTGRLVEGFSTADLTVLRSSIPLQMRLRNTSTFLNYEVCIAPDSHGFTGTKES